MKNSLINPKSIIDSLTSLHKIISITNRNCNTHQLITVTGIESSQAIDHIATYLLGCAAMAIDMDFSIVSEILGETPDSKTGLINDIEKLLGADNNISQDRIEDERNPWILESVGHLIMSLSRKNPQIKVGGKLKALLLVHDDVKDHGIDLLGLHENQTVLGISIGEAKASKSNATKAANISCKSFVEIEQAKHDMHVRRMALTASHGLSKTDKKLFCEAVWKDRRIFIPIICHHSESSFSPHLERPETFGKLKVGSDGILLIDIPLVDYEKFFDSVADKIRDLARAL